MSDDKPVEETYKQLSQYEHILTRPDTYVGSLELQKERLWVYNSEEEKLEFREVEYVPALFKIFDEIIVNAADNYQRDKNMSYIKVNIDENQNEISIENGGRGIPVEIHKEYGIYVPELIFGRLLTSSNYNDNVKKVTGGRNGYGAKLTNIFSTKFVVETADAKQKKYYKQVFRKNMLEHDEPIIKDYKQHDFTRITFQPDLSKFKMEALDEDIIALFKKRVYDMAGVTPKKVSVYLNGEKLNVKDFSSYMDMFLSASKESEDDEDPVKVFESPDERWEVGFSLAESNFQQVSFVNSICTSKGGTHVAYVTEKIISCVNEIIQKKGKDMDIKPSHIKNHMWVFVNCLIENPAFDSQTKETLTLKASAFGSKFDFSESFAKQVKKSGIIDRVLSYAKTRQENKLKKQLNKGNKKAKNLFGIDKLDDANWAGSRKSDQCTLILTEGDSAKSLAMAGIDVVGRNAFGCFPLRGKMLNVRDAKDSQIAKNKEVQNVMKIMGLRLGENYTDTKSLRYGSILIMTDQDVDGSHIKGLVINFIHHFWPSLIKLNGFVRAFITPIVKVSKGNTELSFYTLPQYHTWVQSKNGNVKGWKIKYYKGLGTSSNKEAKEYFSELDKNRIYYDYEDEKDDECIDLAFNKKKAEDRKKWIANYNGEDLDTTIKHVKYEDFINKELIQFSIYDNQRSIPAVCDGLKPSERKILFGCFKRNLKNEIKVSQLIGYVSENSAYHHGEQSLASTIVAMAQNFVGSNNINLLMPNGQFGSRNMGGKDSASSRYIHTTLNKVTRSLFNKDDLPLMDYIVEEGQSIEPKWYIPIIPLILANGSEGIGTGWSTNVPCFNPHDIVESLKNKIINGTFTPIYPWYKGFQGTITPERNSKTKFTVSGSYYWSEEDENTLFITEIPIKKWTKDYKILLQRMMGVEIKAEKDDDDKKKGKGKGKKSGKSSKSSKQSDSSDDSGGAKKGKVPIILDDMKEHHTDNRVKFEVHFIEDVADEYRDDEEKLLKTFRLTSSLSLTNMVAWDPQGKLKKYPDAEAILEEFYGVRLTYYELRKKYIISTLKRELCILDNKVRFILAVISEEIKIRKVKRKDLINQLWDMKFDPMSKIENMQLKTEAQIKAERDKLEIPKEDDNDENNEEAEKSDKEEEIDTNKNKKGGKSKKEEGLPCPAKEYNYLLDMPLWRLTYEKVEELEKQKKDKANEITKIEGTTIETMWMNDLDEFIEVLDEYERQEEEDRLIADKKLKKGGADKAGKRRRKRNNSKKSEKSDKSENETNAEEPKKPKKKKKKVEKEDTAAKEDDDDGDDNPFTIPLKERVSKKMAQLNPKAKLGQSSKRKAPSNGFDLDDFVLFDKALPNMKDGK